MASIFLRASRPNAILTAMGYPVKIQKVERPTNRSYYVNLPVAVAEAIDVKKGETFSWSLEDKNTLTLRRQTPAPKRKPKKIKS